MSLVTLPNNRLILNGNKLSTEADLFAYITKRLKSDSIQSLDGLILILSKYEGLEIAIRHSDTFLGSETGQLRTSLIGELQKHRSVKMT